MLPASLLVRMRYIKVRMRKCFYESFSMFYNKQQAVEFLDCILSSIQLKFSCILEIYSLKFYYEESCFARFEAFQFCILPQHPRPKNCKEQCATKLFCMTKLYCPFLSRLNTGDGKTIFYFIELLQDKAKRRLKG